MWYTLIAIVFATTILSVYSQSLFTSLSGAPTATFNAQYQMFNPYLQGGGLISGTISYDATNAAFQLVNQFTGRTTTELYTFSPPVSGTLNTQCTPAIVSTSPDAQYWKYPGGFQSIASGGTGPCLSATPCTTGTAIAATSSGTTISYTFSRYDGSGCSCLPSYVCLSLPSCQACTGVTVTGGTITCGPAATVNCTGSGSAALIQVTGSSFSVNMPSAQVGYGPMGVMQTSDATTSVSCPTAVHTCTPPGFGTGKFKINSCGALGNQCEISSTNDMMYWPLWDNTDYYSSGVLDSSVTGPGGVACYRYAKSSGFVQTSPPTMNFVLNLWLTADKSTVCAWNTSDGDLYTVTSQSALSAINLAPSACAGASTAANTLCWKPMDIVLVFEFSATTTFQDVINYQNFVLNLPTYLDISPQEVNVGIVIYSANGVVVDTSSIVNTQQLASAVKTTGKFACCNMYSTPSALCCSTNPSATALPTAITTAATTMAGWPTRTYTSKNIILFTQGGFAAAGTGAGQINSALATASTTIRAKAATTVPYASAILNFDSMYIGQDQTVVQILDSVRQSNDARNIPLATTTQLNILGLQSQFDTVVNRVWSHPTTSNLYDGLKGEVSDLCASNNGRACGSCCGDCSCGTVCAAPINCKKLICYNVSLVPNNPVQSNSCCNYTLYICPGFNASNLCQVTQCNFSSDQCSFVSTSCPAPNACFQYQCNPSTGTCDAIATFADPNQCFSASCPTGTAVVYTPKSCPILSCQTSTCINATGACNYTDLPKNPPYSCMTATCNNVTGTSWVYNYPTACIPSDPCQVPSCDSAGQCINVPRCTSTTCVNSTCTPSGSSATCLLANCPPYKLVSGVGDKCQPLQGNCVPKTVYDYTFSSCTYSQTTCSNPDPACTTVVCTSTTGTCATTNLCSPYLNGDQCHPLLAGQCTANASAPNGVNCMYRTQDSCALLSNQTACFSYNCIQSNGNCNISSLCTQYGNNGANKCLLLDTTQCPSCNYNPANCPTLSDPCLNATCVPGSGCVSSSTAPYLNGCSPVQAGNTCLLRDNTTCAPVALGTQGSCTYTPRNCTSPDPCLNSTCVAGSSSSTCSPAVPWKGCTLYLSNNTANCYVRNNASCSATGSCSYSIARTCTQVSTRISTICSYTKTFTTQCVNTTLCPQYQNGNQCLNYSQILANGTCEYDIVQCQASADVCLRAYCDPAVGCTTQALCPNSTVSGQRCNVSNTCNGVCQYQNLQCPTSTDPCFDNLCDPTTGICTLKANCPAIYVDPSGTAQQCSLRTTCSPCTFAPRVCTAPSNPCQNVTCSNATVGGCVYTTWCPQFPLQSNGQQNLCQIQNTCTASMVCSYTAKSCPTPADPCQQNVCIPNTGNCNTSQICALYANNGQDLCQPRVNSSCSGGVCSYSVTSCAQVPVLDCQIAKCNSQTGNCDVIANPLFTAANCTAPTDPCLVIDISGASSGTCCSTVAKCPQVTDKCNQTTCNAGVCQYSYKSCAATNPFGNLCDVSTGCDPNTATCTYNRQVCPQNATLGSCYSGTCNNDTGSCDYAVDPAKCGICNGTTNLCPPLNCRARSCVPTGPSTYNCADAGPLCSGQTGNSCANGTCTNNLCSYAPITLDNCVQVFGDPGICFYWSTNPLFSGCCQKVPVCNQQVDPFHKCMLLICNASTNETCALFDNTDNVCGANKGGDLCQPFVSCDNITGQCTYDDIGIGCAANETRPCYQGLCNSTTGECYSSRLPGCNATAICVQLNVRCPSDACVVNVCNVSDPNGACMVQSVRSCPPLDNCTSQTCDTTIGCKAVTFNTGTCNKTIPSGVPSTFNLPPQCVRVFQNGTKEGCCDTELVCPLFPVGSDIVCSPLIDCQDNGPGNAPICAYQLPNVTCPNPFLVDNITGAVDMCQPLVTCQGGCIYTPVVCNASLPACLIASCNSTDGKCDTQDTCQNDACVQSYCNVNTGGCVKTSQTQCTNDFCVQQQCIGSLKCVTLNQTLPSNCPATPCQIAFTNGSNPSCCQVTPKCVASSICETATCDAASGNCTFTPVCAPKRCSDVACLIVNGQPVCNYTIKPCSPASICETTQPCVETDPTPYQCIKQTYCNTSTDACFAIQCDSSGSTPLCQNVSIKNCDDANPCTQDTCYNSSCHYATCPFTDLCSPQTCVPGQGCQVNPINCNDFDACTVDSCVNGSCLHTPLSCDDGDNCTVDTCDSTLGCKNDVKVCNFTEFCLFYDSTHPNGDPRQPCIRGATAATNTTTGSCDKYVCTNQTCRYYVQDCSSFFQGTTAIAATVGTGILIGIIIAAVICCGLAGGGAYAVYSKNPFEKEASVINNPLYHGTQNEITNPLHKT
jgi:hypothetical protein